MKRLLFLLFILLLCSCGRTPERIDEVAGFTFGELPATIYSDNEKYAVSRQLLTADDFVELSITPLSRQIWRIELIFTEVPGTDDPLASAKAFIQKHYPIDFQNSSRLLLPETEIEISAAFDRSPRGVRCTFTDIKLQKLFLAENTMPETVALRMKKRAIQEIFSLEDALRQFNLDTDTYPESLTGLLTDDHTPQWNGPYIDTIPADPWGNAYIYRRTAEGFELYSSGADGKSHIR